MEGLYPQTPSQRFLNLQRTTNDDKPFSSQLQKTRDFNTSSYLNTYTPTQRAVSNLDSARRTIDQIVGLLSEKRNMNEDALREVRSVNSQIIEDLGHSTYSDYRGNAKPTASTYYLPKTRPSQTISQFQSIPRRQQQEEAEILKNRLKQQFQRNNQMMSLVSRLEEENRVMKREQQMSFGPTLDSRTLRAQNELLKRQLQQARNIPNILAAELEQLKRENQQLRADTIRLLKKYERQ